MTEYLVITFQVFAEGGQLPTGPDEVEFFQSLDLAMILLVQNSFPRRMENILALTVPPVAIEASIQSVVLHTAIAKEVREPSPDIYNTSGSLLY
jgi:hypothetical protein